MRAALPRQTAAFPLSVAKHASEWESFCVGASAKATLPEGLLPETVEYPDHPWFIGVRFAAVEQSWLV